MAGNNAASNESKQARADEAARQARIRAGTASIDKTFGQFDDPFFDSQAKAYTDYARPQIDDQAKSAREKLTYALARNGTLDSSVRSQQFGDVQKQYDQGVQDITDRGRQYATDTRTNVEKARANLIATLQATGDAQAASNGALAQADILSKPPAYSPISQLFQDFTAGLGQQAALERAEAFTGGAIKPRFNTGLFGSKASAVKVS